MRAFGRRAQCLVATTTTAGVLAHDRPAVQVKGARPRDRAVKLEPSHCPSSWSFTSRGLRPTLSGRPGVNKAPVCCCTDAAPGLETNSAVHLGASQQHVMGSIGYLRSPENGQRPHIMMYGQDAEKSAAQLEYIREATPIIDGRPDLAAGQFGLDLTGMDLVRHPTRLSADDFYSRDDKIRTLYYEEVCQAVKKATGAETVVAIHHQVRNEKVALELVGGDRDKLPKYKTNSPLIPKVDGYAVNAHADFSPTTAPRTARQHLHRISSKQERQRHARGRYMMVNAWRNISDDGPILDHHLAVLDGSTLSPEDIVLVDMHYETYTTECAQVGNSSRSKHRWVYFPAMCKEELLLFKQYDSSLNVPARYAVHCSFDDPRAPVDAPPRESIEVRTIAFFPEMTSDLEDPRGLDSPTAFPPASEVAGQLLSQLETPLLWPEDMRQWLRRSIAADVQKAANSLMRQMVEYNADPDNPDGSMCGAPEKLKEEVLQVLSSSDFKDRLQKNFGPRH